MDFNPWGEKTDPMLFEWDELEKMTTEQEVQYKVIEKSDKTQEIGISQYRVPIVKKIIV